MVDYQSSDVLSLEDFALAWRINDDRWSSLPDSILRRIKPLSLAKSRELFENSPLSEPRARKAPYGGRLHATRHLLLEASGNPEEDQRIRRWLQELPIEEEREVYLCWGIGDGIAAISDWGAFVEVWDDLWYPFDRMCVFDETRAWAVLFGPEEEVYYLESAAGGSRA